MKKIPTNQFVLFVAQEDNAELSECRRYLHNYCQNWLSTGLAKDIIHFLGQYPIGLILIDSPLFSFNMPEQLKTDDDRPAMVAMIDHADLGQKKHLINSGFDDSLVKPIDLKLLAELLDVWQIPRKDPGAMVYVSGLLTKTHNNPKLALTIFQKLFVELPKQLLEIKMALDGQHYESARKVTHNLLGSASLCGFIDMQQAAQTLEAHLLRQEYGQTFELFKHLQESTNQLLDKRQAILAYFGQ